MKHRDVDIVVIGSGPAGLTAGFGLHYAGKKLIMVEKEEDNVGGDCTNTGCVPSKAVIHYADKHGKDATFVGALEYAREIRKTFRDEENKEAFKEEHDMELVYGTATFIDKNTVEVATHTGETMTITAKKILICTGSVGKRLDLPGLAEDRQLTNHEIFELTEEVTDLVVVGGGYIGSELSEAFARLGVNITLVQRNEKLIPREEEEASTLMKTLLEEAGATVLTGATIDHCDDTHAYIKTPTSTKKVPYQYILTAIGRAPNVMSLGLENTNVEFSPKGIEVNATNRTAEKSIYALGDCVAGNPNFTHRADHEGRVLVRNTLLRFLPKRQPKQGTSLPTVLYTSKEIARVGMTKEEIQEFYEEDEYKTYTVHTKDNDRHRIQRATGGFITIHFTRVTGKILGVTMAMECAGEMIHYFSLAQQQGISAWKLMRQIYAYPTRLTIAKKVVRPFVTDTFQNRKEEAKFFLSYNKFKIIAVLFWISALIGFFVYKGQADLTNGEIAQSLIDFFKGTMRGPVLFMLGYAIRPLVLFPAVIMTLMGGILFGPVRGIIYTFLGENASASFAYWIGRLLGKGLVKPGSQGIFSTIASKLKDADFLSVFTIRLLPFNFDFVNYSAGILNVKYMPYVIGTALGILPAMTAVVLAGASIDVSQGIDFENFSLNTTYLTIAIVMYVASIAISIFVKRYVKKN